MCRPEPVTVVTCSGSNLRYQYAGSRVLLQADPMTVPLPSLPHGIYDPSLFWG